MAHGGRNSIVVSHRLPDEMGTLRDRVMPAFLHPAINPLLTPETAAHAMRPQPTLLHSHSHFSFPSRLSLLMGLLMSGHTTVCVCANIHPKEF